MKRLKRIAFGWGTKVEEEVKEMGIEITALRGAVSKLTAEM